MTSDCLPVTVVVTTLNEERHIARCLSVLEAFDQIIVVDSNSTDRTVEIARDCGVAVVSYQWDGRYPKKRGWCLEKLDFKHDWIFWVDADEVVSKDIVRELQCVFRNPPEEAGFFVQGRYVWNGQILKHGMKNKKIALFHRSRMIFPPVDDLDIEGMGEIEGHYQPVLKYGEGGKIGTLDASVLHYAYDDYDAWHARHVRYAMWEAEMTKRKAWPEDPIFWRERAKRFLRHSAIRPYLMFLYCYIWTGGLLDGRAGYHFALSRMRYCFMIREAMKD